ncbi:MAG: hypothetical protein WEB03_11615 [Nitriliruptor sp.]|uniref:hypothetical protein n=1 Tax=Nitriliruptor sp. TaxID=2448056 RepID=UPI0034A03D6D
MSQPLEPTPPTHSNQRGAKKYLAAGGVAVVVFAFAASAAQLTVDGGHLQVGSDGSLVCDADGVETHFGGYEGEQSAFNYVDVSGIAQACVGEELFLEVFNNAGARIWHNNNPAITATGMRYEFASGTFGTYDDVRNANNTRVVRGVDVGSVQVKIQTPHPTDGVSPILP